MHNVKLNFNKEKHTWNTQEIEVNLKFGAENSDFLIIPWPLLGWDLKINKVEFDLLKRK